MRTNEIGDLLKEYGKLPEGVRTRIRSKLRVEGYLTSDLPVLKRAAGDNCVPLSHAQERLWFLWRLEPDSPAYNIVGAVRLDGILNVPALRTAVTGLVRRHESLRTRFEDVDGTAWQVIEPEPVFGWTEHDLAAITDHQAREAALREGLDRAAQTPFDLEQGPLLRIELFHLGEQEHVLHFAMHHIVSDGWSIDILVREFSAFYEAALDGRQPDLPELPIQYADYALWQREWLDDEALKGQLDYWKNRLGDEHPVLQLPVTGKPKGPRSNKGGRVTCEIPADVADRLRKLSREHGATLFMTLLAAFDVLLYRYCNESDIRVGVPVAGRQRVETEGLIGFFVNTLVIRSDVRGDMTFGDLLDQVRDRVLEAQANQDLPFAKLVEALQPERVLGQTPLFQVMCSFDQKRASGKASPQSTKGRSSSSRTQIAQFDLTLDIVDDGLNLRLAFDYALDLFEPDIIEILSETYAASYTRWERQMAMPPSSLTLRLPHLISHWFLIPSAPLGPALRRSRLLIRKRRLFRARASVSLMANLTVGRTGSGGV
ncbi:condensation domain-containing protein [Phyllobacterium sp. K27]